MSNIPPVQPNPGFSNYPRSGYQGPPGYSRPPGVYFEAIGDAWRMIQANLGGWVVISLCFFAVTYAVNIPLSFVSNLLIYGNFLGSRSPIEIGRGSPYVFDSGKFLASFAFNSLGYLITLPLQAGLQMTALRAVRGWAVGPGDLWIAFPKIGQVLVGSVIVGLLNLAGAILGIIFSYLAIAGHVLDGSLVASLLTMAVGLLCFIPVFYLTGVLAFVQLLIVDRNMTGIQAVGESYKALKSHGWAMFCLIFVAALCSALGLIACCVGFLFTFPILVLAQSITYNYFFPPISEYPLGYAISMEPPR